MKDPVLTAFIILEEAVRSSKDDGLHAVCAV